MIEWRRSVTAHDGKRLEQAALFLANQWDCPVETAVDRIEALAALALPSEAALPAVLRSALKLRGRRNARLGVDLFRDPAWDMLLELLAAHHEQRAVSVSGLCFASGVPATTALRYVERLVDEGLIVRSGDYGDQRRSLVELAPDRVATVEGLMNELAGGLLMRGGARSAFAVPPAL